MKKIYLNETWSFFFHEKAKQEANSKENKNFKETYQLDLKTRLGFQKYNMETLHSWVS